jgi:hypothetical protein
MSTDVEAIFASLVADRPNCDRTQLQIARRIAAMLADDSDLSASALSALLALLPEKPNADEPPLDYSRLTDKEFHLLDKLVAKAANKALPPAPFEEPKLRRRSPRERQAQELAVLLDNLEAESDAQRKLDWRRPWLASEDDLLNIRNCVVSLVGLVATDRAIFRYLIENAQYEARKEFRDREAADAPAAPAGSAANIAPTGPAADPANVITPPIQTWGVSTGPRDMGPQRSVAHHVRGDVPGWSRPT